jgi:nucleotide-binding universal stress UspA family protein
MATPRATIVAVTSDDQRHLAVLARAAAAARERGATVILFDLDADLGPFESALPTAWSGDGEEEQFGSRLDAGDLDAAGQPRLAERVRALQEAGIQASGWLPPNADADALAEYAARQGADLVLLSTEDTDLIASLRSKASGDADTEPDRGGGIHVEAVPPG